ncbi:MAG: molybdopterin-dependent oxidoreductase [Acidobacteriia bacterium]|nr:molybdopterin-dependent oxidoreductase [Terriglobia bacterium]
MSADASNTPVGFPSRRRFLKQSGALIVYFNFFTPQITWSAPARAEDLAAGPDATALDSWLEIASDGMVTVFTSKVELGTGIETALTQMVAEELDVPFARVKMDAGDTAKTIDQSVTAASRTLERGGPQLRQAAAAARQELLKLASAKLGSPVEKLIVEDGVVKIASQPASKASYADLIGGRHFNVKITADGTGWDMKVAPEVPAKDPKKYKIVGTSVPRVDLPGKFTGEFTYTQDVRLPGMLHGRVIRPPVVNSKAQSVDENSIRHIPGIKKVVQQGGFVGVVAETEWSAIQAAGALKVAWAAPASKLPANVDEVYDYLKNTKSYKERAAVERGNPESAIAGATKAFEATYRWPFQLHGMLGPSCAVADVQPDKATIWAGSQGPFYTRKRLADLLGLPERSVHVLYREGSGSYGRLESDDAAEDAALLSRAVGKPVRVQWMREEEHAWEPKGPAQLMRVRAAIDAQGKVTAWDFEDRSFPWTEAMGNPMLASRQIGLKGTTEGFQNGIDGGGQIYTFENQKVVAALIPWVQPDATPLRTSNLRAPGDLARAFASETFLDEIASHVGADPVEFRLRYLAGNTRPAEVLRATAKRAGWQARPSPAPATSGSKVSGRGVAVTARANTMVAVIAEIDVDKSSGKIAVRKITIGHDCGLIVNPDGLKNQIEGNVIQGVSRALLEEVQFDGAGIKSIDWASYPILTFRDTPEIDIVLVNRPEMPALGGGEPAISPVPAAIANAVFDAVGVRLREAPFTPQRLLRSLARTGLS